MVVFQVFTIYGDLQHIISPFSGTLPSHYYCSRSFAHRENTCAHAAFSAVDPRIQPPGSPPTVCSPEKPASVCSPLAPSPHGSKFGATCVSTYFLPTRSTAIGFSQIFRRRRLCVTQGPNKPSGEQRRVCEYFGLWLVGPPVRPCTRVKHVRADTIADYKQTIKIFEKDKKKIKRR